MTRLIYLLLFSTLLSSCTDKGECDELQDPSTFSLAPLSIYPEIRPLFGAWNSTYDSEFIDLSVRNNMTQSNVISAEIKATNILSTSDLVIGDSLDISIDLVDILTDTIISTITVRSISEDSGDGCTVPTFKNITVSTDAETVFGTNNEAIQIKT